MTYTLFVGGALVTMCYMDFACPKCTCVHKEEDYYKKYAKHNDQFPHCVFYIKCKGCKTKLGVDFDMTGDVVVWLKEEEQK